MLGCHYHVCTINIKLQARAPKVRSRPLLRMMSMPVSSLEMVCESLCQHKSADVSSVEGACSDMLAVANDLSIRFTTRSRLQCHFRKFGSTSNPLYSHNPRVITSAQDLHVQFFHLHDCLGPATCTTDAIVSLHKQRFSAQISRGCLR